ncbi:MAG: TetR/AcrR family transcriptional regulator [Candidatus Omnitrophica bacterium]|nr:TetR/AcrR family transcriptional regulator [Candidatus Omnitrophota bacterium]
MVALKSQIRSSLRQRQAQATANMIVAAAKALFLELGYTGTTIEAIAERAGVAVSTVYAVFNSKLGILRAIRSAWHDTSHIREITYGNSKVINPHQLLEELAQATCRQWETGSDVIAIYNGAAAADAEAAAELSEALAGRRKGMEKLAKSLEPHLRHDLDAARVAAILQALCLPEVFFELVRNSGWALEAYQDWLSGALKRELLGDSE